MAIIHSKQDWTPGQLVNVGFLRLRMIRVDAVFDGKPDIYTLESLDGSKKYEFIPHMGITRIN
jgi:hypothetical protein